MQPRIKQVTVRLSISLLVGGCASTKGGGLAAGRTVHAGHLRRASRGDDGT